MGLQRIVASPLVADKQPDRPVVLADRVADLRALWLFARVATWVSALIAVIAVALGVEITWSVLVALVVAGIMLEAGYIAALLADAVVVLERRLAATAIAFAVWGVLFSHLLGGVTFWGGPLAPFTILALWLPMLRRRDAALVTAITIGGGSIVALAEVAEWIPTPEAVFGLPTADVGSDSARLLVAVFSLLLLIPISVISYERGARQRSNRMIAKRRHAELQADLGQVQTAFRRHRAATDDITRQREELEERNRHLSVLNAVSFALAEPLSDEVALERAIRLVARLLDLRLAQLYFIASEGEAEQHVIAPADEHDTDLVPLARAALVDVATDGRARFSGLPDQDPVGAATPIDDEAYAIAPLQTRDGVIGALAVKGPRFTIWAEAERQLVLLVAREMASAVGNHRLYADAVEHAAGEAVLNEVARALSGDGGGEPIDTALPIIAQHLRAYGIGLVGAADATMPFERGAEWFAPDVTDPESVGAAYLDAAARSADAPGVSVLGAASPLPLPPSLVGGTARTVAVGHIVVSARRAAAIVVVGDATRTSWTTNEIEVIQQVADLLAQHIESEALIRLQSRRIRELSGLAGIAEVLQSTVDLERLMIGFAAALHSVARYRRLDIVRGAVPGLPGDVRHFGSDGRPGAIDPAIDASHPWFALRGSETWAASDGAPPDFMDPADTHGFIVPLRAKGQSFGFAVIASRKPIPNDVRPLIDQAFGQLSIALESASLYRQVTERAARIQVQGNLARIVASVLDLREAFDAFSEEVRWLIPFDRAVMLLIDHEAGSVESYATYPAVDATVSANQHLSGSLAEAVVLSREPMLFRHDDPAHAGYDWTSFGADAAEVAAVPVYRGTVCVGVFTVVRTGSGSYVGDDLSALEEVARLLAVSIERIELFRQSEHNARHDSLTGLANYRLFKERMDEIDPVVSQRGAAVLVVDLDNMKVFNDSRGHAFGDRVLQLVADVLQKACRGSDLIARTGGDEFIVLMEGADDTTATAVADRIQQRLRRGQSELGDTPVPVRLSIGIASSPTDGENVHALVEAGDRAMYEAKFAGGGRSIGAGKRAGTSAARTGERPNRFAEGLIRTVAAGATPIEREALGSAQRFAVGAALRYDCHKSLLDPLRLVVAALGVQRLEAPVNTPDRTTALVLLDGLQAQWDDHLLAADVFVRTLARAALELAWLASGVPDGRGLSITEAVERLGAHAERLSVSPELLATLAYVAKHDEATLALETRHIETEQPAA